MVAEPKKEEPTPATDGAAKAREKRRNKLFFKT